MACCGTFRSPWNRWPVVAILAHIAKCVIEPVERALLCMPSGGKVGRNDPVGPDELIRLLMICGIDSPIRSDKVFRVWRIEKCLKASLVRCNGLENGIPIQFISPNAPLLLVELSNELLFLGR